MAAGGGDQRPIIIKKIKKGGHGHHGGAWKVAYADFVTAMMAFFLLLWLIATSSRATLNGIAEYFTPTIGIKDSMGIGFDGGLTAQLDGTRKSDKAKPGILAGQTPTGIKPGDPNKTGPVQRQDDSHLFDKAAESVKRAFESDPTLRELSDNIIVEQTPEGLKIELQDSDRHAMFAAGNAAVTADGAALLTQVERVVRQLPNYVSITGHTDASQLESRKGVYTNWELSADRANAARRFLLQVGLNPQRVRKIVGMGAAELLNPDDPRSVRNRRVSIILLRGTHLALPDGASPLQKDFLRAPEGISLQ